MPLHCSHEVAARSPGHDTPQCDPVSPGVAATLYLRAALSADAGRRPAFQPHVFRGDAETGEQPGNTLACGGTRANPSFGRASRWDIASDSARAGARRTRGSRPLQAVSHTAHSPAGARAM